MKKGKVYIVGAGPGDIGLITVKGLDCIKRADVIVYDNLINPQLLESAHPDAELIYAGKSFEGHAKEQHEINQLLIDKANEGNTIVRLKGADPFVLGRGGEEAEALAENRIEFEIVPGISSAIAGPAYAGIPVTHRGIASSFAVVTGHEDPSKEETSINWEKLATGVDTLVFLMGMNNLPHIVDKLIECGRSPETSVALIRHGTTPQQKTLTGTLDTIVEMSQQADFKPPVVIIIGEVVKLRDKLAWFENRPLFGKRVLVTRARAQASALSKLLIERGAEPIELPTIEIHDAPETNELDRAILELPEYDWIIFTSANGVIAFWRRIRALNLDSRWLHYVNLGAIGPATADALEYQGIHPDFIPKEYTSDGILVEFARKNINGQKILLPRADIAPKDLVEGLTALGALPYEVTAYTTRQPPELISQVREKIAERNVDVITFTSSSTVTNFLNSLGNNRNILNRATIACIGPLTASTAREAGLNVNIVAQEQTIPGLVEAIEDFYKKL